MKSKIFFGLKTAFLLFSCWFLAAPFSAFAQEIPQISKRTVVSKDLSEVSAQVKDADSDKAESDREESEQTPSVASPASTTPAKSTGKHSFFKDFILDQKAIWTSPFSLKRSDRKWLGTLTTTTAILLLTDKPAPLKQSAAEDIFEASNGVSKLGAGYSTFGFAGGMYLLGKFTHNEHTKETGLLAIEALTHTAIVTSTLKFATSRQRPYTNFGKGEFWSGGSSFPSGHSASAWALATVIAGQYPDKPLVRIAAYGYATAVSISRFTGRNHFASDVVVGSTIGYLTGHFIVRRHSTFDEHKKVTSVAPYFNNQTRTYGLQGSITF
jgi:membrane-associated phospholipid phosphatase